MLMERHGMNDPLSLALYLPVSGAAGSLGGTSASLDGCPASSARAQWSKEKSIQGGNSWTRSQRGNRETMAT